MIELKPGHLINPAHIIEAEFTPAAGSPDAIGLSSTAAPRPNDAPARLRLHLGSNDYIEVTGPEADAAWRSLAGTKTAAPRPRRNAAKKPAPAAE